MMTEHHHGYISDEDVYLIRMSRIEGQARGISEMIDDEKSCIDILTQVSALTRALRTVATGLLDDHLEHCLLDAAKLNDDQAAIKVQEVSDAIKCLIRSWPNHGLPENESPHPTLEEPKHHEKG